MALHLKLDELREQQWAVLMAAQAEQLDRLQQLSDALAVPRSPA